MQKSLHIIPDKCTGCLQCEMACSYENEGVFNPARSRIKVFNFHEQARFVPYTCTQCADAWCMKACPTTTPRGTGLAANPQTRPAVLPVHGKAGYPYRRGAVAPRRSSTAVLSNRDTATPVNIVAAVQRYGKTAILQYGGAVGGEDGSSAIP